MRILFVHNSLRSFVRTDLDILCTAHDVDELDLSVPVRVASLPVRLHRAHLVYAWFASLHSFLPVLGASVLRKPSVVVVGGYDTANVPEIGYGYMGHRWKRYIVRAICREASELLANSSSARDEVHSNVLVRTPVATIYHGFCDTTPYSSRPREALALTVGNVTISNMWRKGHAVFVRAARLLPDVEFVVAGEYSCDAGEQLRAIAPDNVTFTGFLAQTDLDHLYARSSVYVQASAHEGFGCAVAEAMMAGCVPVVSRRGALREVANSHGIYVDECDPSAVAAGVRQALKATESTRLGLRRHILENFSLRRRQDALLELVDRIGRRA